MENLTEQEDRWLRDALHSVSSPAGLRERIHGRLLQEVTAQTAFTDTSLGKMESIAAALTTDCAAMRDHEIVQTNSRGEVSTKKSISRRQMTGWAIALSALVLAFGIAQWSRPFSAEQLAQRALTRLDQLSNDQVAWHTDFNSQLSELAILNGQLRDVQPLGFQDHSGGPIAERCRIWKLLSTTTNKPLYVFDFADAGQVADVSSQLEPIHTVSGGWSVAAMRSGARVVVVLYQGSFENYLYRQLAA